MQARLLAHSQVLRPSSRATASWTVQHARIPHRSLQLVILPAQSRRRHATTQALGTLPPEASGFTEPLEIEPRRDFSLRLVHERNWLNGGPPTPAVVLAKYLDIQDPAGRQKFYKQIWKYIDHSRLPSILMSFMHRNPNLCSTSSKDDFNTLSPTTFSWMAIQHLEKKQITSDDVTEWVWIISGAGADDMIQRFLSSRCTKPNLLLAEILRHDIKQVRSLARLVGYLVSSSNQWKKETQSLGQHATSPARARLYVYEENHNAFEVLVTRLLRQAQRIWPPGIISITHLLTEYFDSVLANSKDGVLKQKTRAHLTKVFNRFIVLLSLPAALNPMSSAHHRWNAQRQLLGTAATFDPPLLLSQDGYRSIVRTLIAQKKTTTEARSAMLRRRSWPPWRQYQDGMDAKHSIEDDFSRVIRAVSQIEEAGYRINGIEKAARIYGGLEEDGTPTINTRQLTKKGRRAVQETNVEADAVADVWVARVKTTRDVQEAWGAFVEYGRQVGKPVQALYYAMFEKLNYNAARHGRSGSRWTTPGDGREVFPVDNTNLTEYQIQSTQPPTLAELYSQMLSSGIRPSGACLNFLIRKARSSDEALGYMLDAGIDRETVLFFASTDKTRKAPHALRKLPEGVLFAYLDMIGRLVQIIAIQDPENATQSGHMTLQSHGRADSLAGDARSATSNVLHPQGALSDKPQRRETLAQMIHIIREANVTCRPSWYVLFRTIARTKGIVPRHVLGYHKRHSVAWRLLLLILGAFRSHGLEVDPEGFLYICIAFENYVKSQLGDATSSEVANSRGDSHGVIDSGVQTLKDMFATLSESQDALVDLPQLLHSLRGAHLHAYVRALGFAGDFEGIIDALDWMVEHQEALESIAEETRNGHLGFEKTILAIRIALTNTEFEVRAIQRVEEVPWWDGWPDEQQVEAYMRGDYRSHHEPESEAKEPETPVKYPTHS